MNEERTADASHVTTGLYGVAVSAFDQSSPNKGLGLQRARCRTGRVRWADQVIDVKMTNRRINLKWSDSCFACGANLPTFSVAWWNHINRTVTCNSCYDAQGLHASDDLKAPKPATDYTIPINPPINAGTAGKSALNEYERLHEKR